MSILKDLQTRNSIPFLEEPAPSEAEMIEVYKIPIIEKLGIYLNVAKRKPSQSLPDLMLKALKFTRVKD